MASNPDIQTDRRKQAGGLKYPLGRAAHVDRDISIDSIDTVLPATIYTLKGQTLELNDLDPGQYWITVDLINGSTGRVYSHGEGQATVETGKTASAHVTMYKVVDSTGSLVITLDDGGDFPGGIAPVESTPVFPTTVNGCPLLTTTPECVKTDHGFAIMDWKLNPATCEWTIPVPFEQIAPKASCVHLPGAERFGTLAK